MKKTNNYLIALLLLSNSLFASTKPEAPNFVELEHENTWVDLHQSGGNRFKLQDGKVVRCYWNYVLECGMQLRDCENGMAYWCQHNVKVLK